jgi:hypothetical protein
MNPDHSGIHLQNLFSLSLHFCQTTESEETKNCPLVMEVNLKGLEFPFYYKSRSSAAFRILKEVNKWS